MIIVIYTTFIFLVLRFAVTLFNFVSDPKLRRVNRNYSALVSILVPARNEEDNILSLLHSILAQDYQNYEVIVVDDGSTDRTFRLCADFSESHPAFRVIRGAELGGAWLGKNFACHQLAELAKGEFLLFLDADEQIRNGVINSAVHRMYMRRLALLSLFTNQRMQKIGEKAVVPLLHYILLNLLPLRLVYLSKSPAVAAASGQFMLFDAAAYRRHRWHDAIRDEVVADTAIMQRVKSAGLNAECLLANGMVSCRMYRSYGQAISGLGKHFLAAFNYHILSFILFLLLLTAGPMVILTTLNVNLIALMAGLIILTRIMISFLAGESVLVNLLLHPIQMCSMMLIAASAIQRYLTRTTVWKGRRV